MTTTIELTAAEFRTLLASRRPDVAMYSEFKESEHPRADDGKFATAARAGSSGTKSEDTSTSVESRRPTDSKEFKTWFHKSKVVDKHGKPLVVFHGTTKDFDSFKKSEVDGSQRSTWLGNLGSWFAAPSLRDENYDEGNAESVAESFTEDPNTQFDYKSGANVKPCYLSIRNPAEFEGHDHLLDTIDDEFDGDSERFKKHLESQNHDGIVIRNSMTDGFVDRDDWIAFHPSQIKSVWNRGTFDPKDERMNYALVRQFNGAIARYGIREDIEAAAAATHTEPTEAQKKAGNYAKGKFRLHGLEIAIETPAGTMRRGKDANGKEWEHEMPHHYGYILRTESEADGDHVDVFIGPDPHCELAFVVDQRKPSKRFDEHKVMLGWRNEAAARKAYLAAYTDGWTGFMAITPMTIPELREWLRTGDTSKPVAKYSNVDLFNDVVAQYTADFEQKHPRDDDGQFASSGSSGKKVTRKSVTAAELHGAKSDLPVKKNVGYHGTTREAAEAILKSGFDLSKVRPRWQNDLAVSMASSISGVQKHFGKDAKGRGEVILKITWKGRHVTDPRDLNVQAKDAKSYTHAVVKSGVDAAKSGGTTYLYNPDAIESIEIVDPDSETKKYALAHGLFEDAIAKYDDWITIGGRPEGGKQHAGGTPVQLDGAGRIAKGPASLRGRSLSSVDRNVQRPAAQPPTQRQQTEQPAPKPEQSQPDSKPPKVEAIDPLADLRKRLAVQTTYKVKIRKSDETTLRSHGMDSRKAAYIMGAQSHATAEIWKPGAKNCFAMAVIKGTVDGVGYEMNRRLIADENGNSVLKNDYFVLNGQTGKGVGMKIFAQQVDAAVDAGISRIETIACRSDEFEETQYNGYYTWARFGYDAPLSTVNLKQPLPSSLQKCENVSDLMKTAEGRNWWRENGNTFAGTFDLSEGSQSRKVLDAYRQQKAAAANGGPASGSGR